MKSILVIESDNDSLILLKEILEEKGYNVLGTTGVSQAFEIINRGIEIQLIIISTFLEGAESFHVIKRFKEHDSCATIPIIAAVSSIRTAEGPCALQEGCSASIAKPLEEEKVIETVKSVLR